jgi:hypothetical protein
MGYLQSGNDSMQNRHAPQFGEEPRGRDWNFYDQIACHKIGFEPLNLRAPFSNSGYKKTSENSYTYKFSEVQIW